MSKRTFPLIALTLTAAVLFTVVAHACSDLISLKAIVQAPCDHSSSQNEPRSKSEKDNCDAVRYGMLSTRASSAETELSKFYSTRFKTRFLSVFAARLSVLFWRSQAPPFRRAWSFAASFSRSSPHLVSPFLF